MNSGGCSGPVVRALFSQGLEQNSIEKVCCQELFLCERLNTIEFAPMGGFYWNEKLQVKTRI